MQNYFLKVQKTVSFSCLIILCMIILKFVDTQLEKLPDTNMFRFNCLLCNTNWDNQNIVLLATDCHTHVGLFSHTRSCCTTWTAKSLKSKSPQTDGCLQLMTDCVVSRLRWVLLTATDPPHLDTVRVAGFCGGRGGARCCWRGLLHLPAAGVWGEPLGARGADQRHKHPSAGQRARGEWRQWGSGSWSVGSDVDGRDSRGRGRSESIPSSFEIGSKHIRSGVLLAYAKVSRPRAWLTNNPAWDHAAHHRNGSGCQCSLLFPLFITCWKLQRARKCESIVLFLSKL